MHKHCKRQRFIYI